MKNAGRLRGGNAAGPYTPSRHYPHGQAEHDEARFAANRRPIQDILLPEVGAALARGAPERKGKVDLGGKWLGRKLGEGAYGTVYLTDANPTLLALPAKLSHGFARAMPRRGIPVIVKVAKNTDRDLAKFKRDNLKENAVHDYFSTAPCMPFPDTTRELCIAPHVPKLCFCGLAPGGHSYVTVMTLAPGKPLGSQRDAVMSAELYVRIERLVATMWAHGIVHNDLHLANIMYDPPSGHLTVIDFGFGTLLPPDLAARVKAALSKGLRLGVRSLGELWREPGRSRIGTGLQSYANRAVYTHHTSGKVKWDEPWYNPEGGTLMRMYSRLTPTQQANVPALRRKEWGYVGPVTGRYSKAPARNSTTTPRKPGTPKTPRTPANVAPGRRARLRSRSRSGGRSGASSRSGSSSRSGTRSGATRSGTAVSSGGVRKRTPAGAVVARAAVALRRSTRLAGRA